MSTREDLVKQLSRAKQYNQRIDLLEQIARAEPGTPITFTTANFTQPAVGGTVIVEVDNVVWMPPESDLVVRVGKDWGSGFVGGTYTVLTVDEENSRAILRLEAYGSPSAAGTTILSNSPVAVSGRDGLDGKSFATLTEPYTTPAVGFSSTAHVDSTNLFVVGDRVKLGDYSHEVTSINVGAKTVALENLNSSVGITYSVGSKIIVAVAQDATEITATTVPGIDPSPASGTVQQKLAEAGQRLIEADARIKRRVYTVTSVVGVSDGGTVDSLTSITPVALGFSDASALNTYLSTNSIIVSVSGYRTPGDGGGGEFYRDANSTDTPNGGTVFDAIGGGRWLRSIKGNYSIAMWGVFPSSDFAGTDHRPIIQGALDYVASLSTNQNRSILEIPATDSNAYIINSYHPSFAGYGLVCPARVEITGLGAKDQVIFANGDNVALTAIITTTPNADVRRVKWQHLGFNGRFRSQYSAFFGNPLTLQRCPRSEVDDCYFANSLKGQLYVYSFLTVIRRCYAVGYPSTATPGDLPHIGTWIPADPVNPNYVFGFRATGGTSLHFEQNYANRVDIGFDIDSVYSSGVSNAVDVAELAYVLRGGGIKWHGGAEYVKMLCYSAAETADVSLYGSPVFVTKDLSACEHMSGARTDYLIQVEASCTLKVNALDFRPSSALRDSFPVKNYFYTAGALHLPRFLGTPKLVLTAFPDTYGSVGGRLINDTWVDVELREPGKNSGFYTIEGASGDFCFSFDYDYTGTSSSDHPTFRVLSSTGPLNNCNPGKAKAKRYEIDAAFAFTTPDANSHNIFAKWLLDIRYYADRFGTGVVSGTHDVSPITITSVGHGLTTGNRIHVGGNRNYIGNYSSCTVTDADTFTLPVKFNEAASDTLVWGRPSYTKRVTQVSNDSGIDGKSSGSIGLAIFSSAVEDLFTLRKQTNTFWMNQGKVIEGNHYRIDTLGTLNLGTLFPATQAADFISNAGKLRATSVGHGLVSGNFVAISGTSDYDSSGRYVTVIDADTYDVFSDAARTVAVTYVSDQSGMVNPRIAHPVDATGLLALQTGYPTFGTGILEITFPTPATGLKSRVVIKLKETSVLSESDPLDQPSNISLNKGY